MRKMFLFGKTFPVSPAWADPCPGLQPTRQRGQPRSSAHAGGPLEAVLGHLFLPQENRKCALNVRAVTSQNLCNTVNFCSCPKLIGFQQKLIFVCRFDAKNEVWICVFLSQKNNPMWLQYIPPGPKALAAKSHRLRFISGRAEPWFRFRPVPHRRGWHSVSQEENWTLGVVATKTPDGGCVLPRSNNHGEHKRLTILEVVCACLSSKVPLSRAGFFFQKSKLNFDTCVVACSSWQLESTFL